MLTNLPQDWRVLPLGEAGGLGIRQPSPFDGTVPYLATADVVGRSYHPAETVPYLGRPARAGLLLKEGDVVQAKMQSTDKGMVVGREQDGWLASTGFAQFVPSRGSLEGQFLFHWLTSQFFLDLKDRNCTGSTQKAIPDSTLRQLPVPVPPLHEQRRIADILDAADAAIGEMEALISKLKRIRTGLMHDLFTRGLDERGELRDPDAHPEQFKDSPLGLIPREWKVKQLSSCVRTDAPITYGIVQAGPHIEGGVPYIRTGDMAGNFLKPDGLMRTSKQIASSYRRSEVRTGEIVCAIRATVGKVLEVPPELDGANLTQGTARIAPREDVNNHFLLWALCSETVRQQFDLAIKGTTFSEITLGELRKVLIPLPSSCTEQQRIAEMLDAHDDRIRAEEAYRNKLKLQKVGLMEDLLTGRVRVNTAQEVGA